jgi:hypothetical protein
VVVALVFNIQLKPLPFALLDACQFLALVEAPYLILVMAMHHMSV